PPHPTPLPYTTLFRSHDAGEAEDQPRERAGGDPLAVEQPAQEDDEEGRRAAEDDRVARPSPDDRLGEAGQEDGDHQHAADRGPRSEEHTSELQSRGHL